MSRVAASDLRKLAAELISRAEFGHERIILQRHGKDAAVIIPMEDLELLEALEDQYDVEEARAARAEAKVQGTKALSVVMEEIKRAR